MLDTIRARRPDFVGDVQEKHSKFGYATAVQAYGDAVSCGLKKRVAILLKSRRASTTAAFICAQKIIDGSTCNDLTQSGVIRLYMFSEYL